MTRLADLKDSVHSRLLTRCEIDPRTGCWIWTGCWQSGSGLGMIRVAGSMFTTHRAAWWVYRRGFNLWDMSVRVYHHGCRTPACFNPEHLEEAPVGWLNPILAALGRFQRTPTSRPPPTPRPAPTSNGRMPSWVVFVEGHKPITVEAHTASEARAAVKGRLGIGRKGRLPIGSKCLRADGREAST